MAWSDVTKWPDRVLVASKWLALALATYVICAISFTGFYEKWQFREDNQEYSLDLVLDGTVIRPVAYRRLLPDVADAVDRALPVAVKDALFRKTSAPDFDFRAQIPLDISGDPRFATRYYVILVGVFAAAFAAFVAFFLLARSIGASGTAAYGAAAITMLAIPLIETKGGYYYDYPELAFLCAFLAIARDKRLILLLLPIAVLAEWNKETFLAFIPCAFPFLREQIGTRRAGLVLGACMALAAGVFMWLRFRLAHIPDPRGSIWERLADHFDWFTTPARVLENDITYGVLMPPGIALLLAVIFLGIAIAAWRELAVSARKSILLALGINLPLFFLFCAAGELRNLSMLIPGVVMTIAVFLDRLIRAEPIGVAAPATP